MEIVKDYLTRNPCWKANENPSSQSNASQYVQFQKNGPKGGMLHSVGCPQPSASVFVKNWNKETYTNACVHAFIDANNGTVHETLKRNFRGWHGGGSCNNTHFGVEMCEPDCIRYTSGTNFICTDYTRAKAMVKRTYDSAVEYFAEVFHEFGLDPLKKGVLVSHAEGYKFGIASGHGDPEHLWKGLGMPYSMDTFRTAVAERMKVLDSKNDQPTPIPEKPPVVQGLYRVRKAWNESRTQIGAFTLFENAKALADSNPGYFVFDANGVPVYPVPLRVGDKVKVLDNVTYTGKRFKVYYDLYDVLQIQNDRVVIGIGSVVTCAIHINNISKA